MMGQAFVQFVGTFVKFVYLFSSFKVTLGIRMGIDFVFPFSKKGKERRLKQLQAQLCSIGFWRSKFSS